MDFLTNSTYHFTSVKYVSTHAYQKDPNFISLMNGGLKTDILKTIVKAK